MSKLSIRQEITQRAKLLLTAPQQIVENATYISQAVLQLEDGLGFPVEKELDKQNLAMYLCTCIPLIDDFYSTMSEEQNPLGIVKQTLRDIVQHPQFNPLMPDNQGRSFLSFVFRMQDAAFIKEIIELNPILTKLAHDPKSMFDCASAMMRDNPSYRQNPKAAMEVVAGICHYIPREYLAAHLMEDPLLLRGFISYQPQLLMELMQLPESTLTTARDSHGRTFMHHLCIAKEPWSLYKGLRELPALQKLIHVVDNHGDTPLAFMMRKRPQDKDRCVEWLLPYHPNLIHQNAHGNTPLMEALLAQDVDTVRVLVDYSNEHEEGDIGVNIQNTIGQAPIDILNYDTSNAWGELGEALREMSVYTTVPDIGLQQKKAEYVKHLQRLQRIEPSTLMIAMDISGAQNVFFVDGHQKLHDALTLLRAVSLDYPDKVFQLNIQFESFFGHYTTLYMDIQNGHATSAFYESLGLTRNERSGSLIDYAERIAEVFPGDPMYMNAEKTQRDSKSCTIISLDNVLHGQQYRREGLFERLAQYAYTGEALTAEKARLHAEANMPTLLALEEIKIVKPFCYPPAMYQHAQYLAPIHVEPIGREKIGERALQEHVQSTTRYSEYHHKPFNKYTKIKTTELLEQSQEFLETASEQKLDSVHLRHSLAELTALQRFISRVVGKKVDMNRWQEFAQETPNQVEDEVGKLADEILDWGGEDDLTPPTELPPPPPTPGQKPQGGEGKTSFTTRYGGKDNPGKGPQLR